MRRDVWLVPALLLLGCSSGAGSSGPGAPEPSMVGANGVTLTQVSIYQGPKRVLMQDGAQLPGQVPLVAGRPAFMRLFYTTDAAYDGQQVLARLELADGTRLEGWIGPLGTETLEQDVGSGAGFFLSGEQVGASIDYSVGLLQERSPESDNPAARWSESIPVEGHKNTLRIVIVPYRYDYDGSGRLPNTSEEQVGIIKNRFLGMYPISNVEVSVREPVPWSQAILPDGTGWQAVGFNLASLRNAEKTGDDIYYYGMFNPAANLYQYCGGGCLLGVTLLNDNPPETGTSMLRLALGVGFEAEAPNTCAHEIGHAHGRAHVNCGYGVAPDSVDWNYPYDTHSIGGWGWDITSNTLMDPSHSDIMGYCTNQWISDYHYGKLFIRTQNVNLEELATSGGVDYDIVGFDGLGAVDWLTNVHRAQPIGGSKLTVVARDASGTEHTLEGVFVRYDHLPGGWLVLPAGQASEINLTLDGKQLSAKRP